MDVDTSDSSPRLYLLELFELFEIFLFSPYLKINPNQSIDIPSIFFRLERNNSSAIPRV